MDEPTAPGTVSSDSPRREPARVRWSLPLFALIATLVVAADQGTKFAIRGWLSLGETWPSRDALLRLSHVENSGAAFGIFEGAGAFLVLTTLAGIAALLAYALLAPTASQPFQMSLALILGGAIGNFIDRLFRGTVTDFIDPVRYPAFNLADSAIVIGASLLVLLTLFADRDRDVTTASEREEAA